MTTKLTEKNISSVANAGINWQSVIVADGSTGTTGVAGRGYFINTTSAAHIFTLPATATFADTILIKDYAGTFATFNLTIARNGHNIQGSANNSLINTNRASVVLVYVDVTRGWEFVTESNVAFLGPLFISATGGTITTSGDFKIHSFTGDGCFVVTQAGNPTGSTSVDYLVVAGGGGGGRDDFGSPSDTRQSGGGGAGGFRISNSYGLPAPTTSPLANPTGITVTATSYPITVGAGGGGGTGPCGSDGSTQPGAKGSDSIFSTITSAGGGGGMGHSPGPPQGGPTSSAIGKLNGGSGGGILGCTYSNPSPTPVGRGNTPPVSPPQGNNGGPTGNGSNAGGGGGAGAVGGTSPSFPVAANGGVGSYISPSFAVACAGTSGPVPAVRYFAGGGASGGNGTAGTGGSGGGGANTNGTVNTGGGGSGRYKDTTGNGGSGIVIIRYKFQ